jgi:osmoprotectant transport system substrate-binding protein
LLTILSARPILSYPVKVALLALTITITVTVTSPLHACVGRKLVLGSLEADRPAMVSRLLSILIHERTGTTIEVDYFSDKQELLKSVDKGKVDLYVDSVDSAFGRIGEGDVSLSKEERFQVVKKRFDEELNLIWLKPMGYNERDEKSVPTGPAAVVVRKDTLKTFPALPRLLEKIGTRIVLDDDLLDTLVKRGQTEKPVKVARDYLKEVKLI